MIINNIQSAVNVSFAIMKTSNGSVGAKPDNVNVTLRDKFNDETE